MIIRRKLQEGELSCPQLVFERIRQECGVSKESFYGSVGAAKAYVFQHGNRGLDLVQGFLAGMHIMQRTVV